MATYCTESLTRRLAALGEDAREWAAYFNAWKASGPAGEYSDYFFGKDAAYANVRVDGLAVELMHVHLVPLADSKALKIWDRNDRLKKRKTSDRALVYARDGKGNYLLIAVLDEPDAHAIAQMRSAADRELMQDFAQVAEAFAFDGSIIA